ncbi:retrovirus-related pol polyprotein from transposon TNT 1-94 [Tanacetum coccineum]
MKDKVLPNTSQVKFKKTEVKDHLRIYRISNQTKSVTASNDSLNSRTSNVNVVCATCGNCVFNLNHDACVSKYLNDVNARTKKPNVVPICSRKPKSQANKSVATPHKKTVASESTTTNSKSYYRMLYKKTNKAWKCWIAQQCPSAYTWVPKDKKKWVPKVRNENVTKKISGNDLLTGNRGTDLYTISLQETTSSTPICLMAKASPTQAWLWHRRLSHLNFDYINLLSKKDVVIGLPKLKYVKDQLCSSCEVSKAKRSSFKSKTVPSSKGRLNLLHMDLCGPMRVASINGKKYILVIVDDYSRYTWTLFLRSKDETPEVLKDFLTMIQRNLQALVISVRTDRGTEFLNKTLNAFFKEEGIEHQTSTPRTPEQNGVVERRNRTLVEAARTMLSASKLPLFFWAEAIATACYTQNRSIIIPTHEKTAYHIINDRKPLIKHLHIFGCTCYLTRDGENLDKMKEKGDPCILVGYSTQSKGYRVYNKRTRLIVESIHLRFDEIKEMSETSVANDTSGLVPQRQKASDYDNPDPAPELQNVSPSADTTVPSQQELDLLFSPLYDEFFNDGTSHVTKSSSSTDNSIQKDTTPSMNIQPPSEPSTPTNVHAKENNDHQAEFTNPFCTPQCRKSFNLTDSKSGNSLTNPLARTIIAPVAAWNAVRFLSHMLHTRSFPNLSMDVENGISNGPLKRRFMFHNQTDSLILDLRKKVYRLRKALYGLKSSSESLGSGFELTAFSDADVPVLALNSQKHSEEYSSKVNVDEDISFKIMASTTTKYRCIATLSQPYQSHATPCSTPVPSTSILEHPSDTYVLTMKMEILLEPALNKLLVDINQSRRIELASFQEMQSMSMFVKTQDRNVAKTIKTKIKDLNNSDEKDKRQKIMTKAQYQYITKHEWNKPYNALTEKSHKVIDNNNLINLTEGSVTMNSTSGRLLASIY